jgi:hypothetical protein
VTDFLPALLRYAILVAGGMVLACGLSYVLTAIVLALIDTVAYVLEYWRSRD